MPRYGYSLLNSPNDEPSTGQAALAVNTYYQDQSVVPLGAFDGVILGYEYVTESQLGNGKSVYQFQIEEPEFGNDLLPNPPKLATILNGKPLITSVFKENENDPIQINQTESAAPYSDYPFPDPIYMVRQFQHGCIQADVQNDYSTYLFEEYYPRTAPYLVKKQITTIDGVSTTTEFSYNADRLHFFPIEQKITDSGNRIQIQRFKYPEDYQSNLSFGSGTNVNIPDLFNQYMVGTPIETQTWEGTDENNLKMVGGQISLYKDFRSQTDIDLNNPKILKPFQIYLLETDTGLEEGSGLNNSKDGNGLYQLLQPQQVSSAYQLRASFFYEDTYGNLVEQSLTDGTPIAFLWGLGGNRPLAQVVGKTYNEINSYAPEQLRLQFDQALVTTYEYNDRLQLKSVTGPDGITTHYEYDALGRLINTSDDDEKLLQQVFYNYGNQ